MGASNDICESFLHAKNKKEQLYICADVYGIDVDTVIEILRDHHLCVKQTKCRKCSEVFDKFIDPYCPKCREMVEIAKEREANRKKMILRWVAENEALRQDYLKKAEELQKENVRLVEWLV